MPNWIGTKSIDSVMLYGKVYRELIEKISLVVGKAVRTVAMIVFRSEVSLKELTEKILISQRHSNISHQAYASNSFFSTIAMPEKKPDDANA